MAHLQSLADSSHCKENIQQHLNDYKPDYCDYYLGEVFLLAMYTVLGEEGVSATLRDLQTQALEYGSDPHYLIYQAFEKHTPSGKEEAFQAAYRRYYGGSIIPLARPSPDRRTVLAALYNVTDGSGWANQ